MWSREEKRMITVLNSPTQGQKQTVIEPAPGLKRDQTIWERRRVEEREGKSCQTPAEEESASVFGRREEGRKRGEKFAGRLKARGPHFRPPRLRPDSYRKKNWGPMGEGKASSLLMWGSRFGERKDSLLHVPQVKKKGASSSSEETFFSHAKK